LYHFQFSFKKASPETFGYTLVSLIIMIIILFLPRTEFHMKPWNVVTKKKEMNMKEP